MIILKAFFIATLGEQTAFFKYLPKAYRKQIDLSVFWRRDSE